MKWKRGTIIFAGIFLLVLINFISADSKWEADDHYFASEDISVNDFWLNKYSDYSYGQIVSRASMKLNNLDEHLTKKTINVTIAYPSEQEFLGINIISLNPSEEEKMLEDPEYIPKETTEISPIERTDKEKEDKYSEISDKLSALSITDEEKETLAIDTGYFFGLIGNDLKKYTLKTFEVEFVDDEEYLIQAFISSEYGLKERIYIYIEGSFAGGSGTSEDPYQIETWAQLNETRDYLSSSFILMNDLSSSDTGYDTYASSSANGGAGWDPLGDSTTRFTGTFDGGNHTISDLYISRGGTNFNGLFGYFYLATVNNVGVVDCNITGAAYTGGLIGFHYGGTSSYCYSTGIVSASGTNTRTGGLIGWLIGNNAANSNSYSTANVSGYSYVGGLVGDQSTSSSTITNSYSTGSVSGSSNVGGLVGLQDDGTNTGCFWDTQTSGQATSGGEETGKTTAQMQDYDTFNDAGWDIALIGSYVNEIWYIDDGNDYPHLGWEYEEAGDTCTYTSGNWEVDCSDNCVISSPVDVGGNNISITGTGTFTMTADVSNFNDLYLAGTDSSNRCEVYCLGGCFAS